MRKAIALCVVLALFSPTLGKTKQQKPTREQALEEVSQARAVYMEKVKAARLTADEFHKELRSMSEDFYKLTADRPASQP